ncbi:MAG: serine/threonine-protein kinase [Sandaracinus sp.]
MQEPGTIVGERYKLVRKIGEGGLAAVWEAEHLTLGSRIAVKFLHRTGPMQSEASQRFLREARVAASVRHRNVVEIVDFGFAEGEIPYMVMEFLEGRSLGAYLEEKGRLPFDEAARIIAGTLRGLAAVHAAGLVHRDIKPDNVFLVDDAEEGFYPKLVDFGLSRRAGRSDMTAEGTLMGTPQYMSPEQAMGQTDLDARADIYAVGVVLYELVSGVVPFDSDSLADILTSVVHTPPKPLKQLVPEVPDKLAFVVETAMAKDREHRFVDARAMRNSLIDTGVYANEEPPSGLIQRLSIDEAEAAAVSPTLPARAAITGPNAVLRADPSGHKRRDPSTGIGKRRDPSTKRDHAADEQVGVFTVAKGEEDEARERKGTPVTAEAAVPKAEPADRGGMVLALGALLVLVVAGGLAWYAGIFASLLGDGGSAGGGGEVTPIAEGAPDGGEVAADAGPAAEDALVGEDAAAPEDAFAPEDDAAEPAIEAPAPPTKRGGVRRPTKRTGGRRPVRRRR